MRIWLVAAVVVALVAPVEQGAARAAPELDQEHAADRADAGDELDLEAGEEVIEFAGEAPDDGESVSYQLDAEHLRVLPGTGGDTLKAIQTLPGAARIPYGLGGLVLRGTNPRDSKVYLDGVQVPILYHFGGLASFYPSALLETVEVTPGGFGAAFGRGQGGLVTVRSRAPRPDRWRVGGEVSLLDASARAEGPTAGDGAISLGLRRSYIDGILALVMDPDERVLPRYHDAQLRWDTGAPRVGAWTGAVVVSQDRISGDGAALTSGFVRSSVTYRRRWGGTNLTAVSWLGRDLLRFSADPEPGDPDPAGLVQGRTTVPAGVRAELVRDLSWGHVAGGIDVQGARHGPLRFDIDDRGFEASAPRWSADLGAWVEGRYRFDQGKLGLTPGLRLDRFGLTGEWLLAPRLTATHELHRRFTLRESLGIYHQPPTVSDVDPVFGNPALPSSRAVHAAIGVDVALFADVGLQLTGFHLTGERQPTAVTPPASWGSGPPERTRGGLGAVFEQLLEEQFGAGQYRDAVGRARSYGLEVAARRQVGRWLGMLSYTVSRAERTDDPTRFVGWRRYELDQTHNLTAVATTRVGAWQLGGRLRYATGNPYTPVIGIERGLEVYGDPMSARLPAYAQLDVRADRQWRRSRGTIKAFFDVQNLTNRANAESATYEQGETRYLRGLPILPFIGVEYAPHP